MSGIRTDLALEKHENHREESLPGVKIEKSGAPHGQITRIEITDKRSAEKLEKPVGVYYTFETEGFPDAAALSDGRRETVTGILRSLMPEQGTVLVVGLGNPNITPDALGPRCAEQIFSTRHIDDETRKLLSLPPLREVCAISPGVTGQTGVEAVEVIDGICRKIAPEAVIAVDALAAGSVRRLARTVQISNVGIEPGAGVGNARRALNRKTLGIPVIAVGVPTVVDALSLSRDVLSGGELSVENSAYASMIVTPRETDTVIESAARMLALAINCALQDKLSQEELLSLM